MDVIATHLKEWYRRHTKNVLKDYFELLKIPSISTDPSYHTNVLQAAEWVQNYLNKIGMETTLWETCNYPVVFATHFRGPSYPTLMIYHHYDVQPIDPLEKWISPPFEPTVRNDRVYARGASDNKGQCAYTLSALKAIFELYPDIPLNLKLVIEGEEESGSKGLSELLHKKKDLFQADYLLVVDVGMPSLETPSITLGLRGIDTFELSHRNGKTDLHSGIYGGFVLNPIHSLLATLTQLWDQNGKIVVPHFYDQVIMPSQGDLDEFYRDIDTDLFHELDITALKREGSYSYWESNTLRPSLEINGIWGGYTGTGSKTIIPSAATAKISVRLVPNQEPQPTLQLILDYLKSITPSGIKLEYSIGHSGKGIRCSPHSKIARLCIRTYEKIFNKPCRKLLSGASIPLVADLKEVSGAEVVMIGTALDSDDIHAPNEHFSLFQFEMGFLIIGTLLKELTACE